MPPCVVTLVGIVHAGAQASKEERLEQEAGPCGTRGPVFAHFRREFVSWGVRVREYSRGRRDGDDAEMGSRHELRRGGVR